MNRYVYGLILACALLSLPSVNCAEAAPDASEEAAVRASKEAYIQECIAAGADKREARRLAREEKEAAQKAKDEAEAKQLESEAGSE